VSALVLEGAEGAQSLAELANRVLSAMRQQFGGHQEKPDPT